MVSIYKKNKPNKTEPHLDKKMKKFKERERIARERAERNKAMHEEFRRKYQAEREKRQKNKGKKRKYIMNIPIKINNIQLLPKDIQCWIKSPTKKKYYMLMKKYHPDKNNNNDNEYVKIITSYWDTIKK